MCGHEEGDRVQIARLGLPRVSLHLPKLRGVGLLTVLAQETHVGQEPIRQGQTVHSRVIETGGVLFNEDTDETQAQARIADPHAA